MWGLNNIMDVVCDLRINKLFTIDSYIYMYKPTEVQKFSFLCDLFKDQGDYIAQAYNKHKT